MKLLSRSLRLTTLSVITTALLTGCASLKPERLSPAPHSTDADTRTLADPGLKRFLEANLKRRLEPSSLETWDLPTLTLAASYFRTDLERTRAWQVRANVRTNLLLHVAAQRRLELLNALSEFQSAIIRHGENGQTDNETSWEELSAVNTEYAHTLIARLDALEQLIQSRMRLAEVVGVPVGALLQVELRYDFARGVTNEFSATALRRLALQNRSDTAGIDRSVAAHEKAQKHLADRLARLSARERTRDALVAEVGNGTATNIELLLSEARVSAARLYVFDAQVQVQHTLGSLEDAVRQPAELFGIDSATTAVVSTHE